MYHGLADLDGEFRLLKRIAGVKVNLKKATGKFLL